MISTEVTIRTQFYDLDPMNIVWHGNYVRYLEQARAALLGGIGFGYREMKESGFAWPIVDLSIRYVRPLQLNQDFVVRATLTEYENRLCISYRVLDAASREVLTKARTVQAAAGPYAEGSQRSTSRTGPRPCRNAFPASSLTTTAASAARSASPQRARVRTVSRRASATEVGPDRMVTTKRSRGPGMARLARVGT